MPVEDMRNSKSWQAAKIMDDRLYTASLRLSAQCQRPSEVKKRKGKILIRCHQLSYRRMRRHRSHSQSVSQSVVRMSCAMGHNTEVLVSDGCNLLPATLKLADRTKSVTVMQHRLPPNYLRFQEAYSECHRHPLLSALVRRRPHHGSNGRLMKSELQSLYSRFPTIQSPHEEVQVDCRVATKMRICQQKKLVLQLNLTRSHECSPLAALSCVKVKKNE